jgi:hypothetical protein
MTSSGTYAYSLSNGEAVLAAYERVHIRAPAIRQEHMLTARRELNLLFSELSNRGVNLWKVEQLSVDMVSGTPSYDIPGRVVMILDAYISLNNGTTEQTDRYVTPISRTDYSGYGSKFTPGPPNVDGFDRLSSPTITMWPVPDSNGPYVFNYYACSQMQDAALIGGQTPDLPYRWLDVLVTGLAKRLARSYPPDGMDALAFEKARDADYDAAWAFAATQDTENVPVSIAPNIGSFYRR